MQIAVCTEGRLSVKKNFEVCLNLTGIKMPGKQIKGGNSSFQVKQLILCAAFKPGSSSFFCGCQFSHALRPQAQRQKPLAFLHKRFLSLFCCAQNAQNIDADATKRLTEWNVIRHGLL